MAVGSHTPLFYTCVDTYFLIQLRFTLIPVLITFQEARLAMAFGREDR